MRLIIPDDQQANEAIGAWLASKLDVVLTPPYYAVGIVRTLQDPLIGALVFNSFNGHQIEMSGYGPGVFTPSIIRQLAHYVFIQLGCVRLSVRTKRANGRTRKMLAKHFKFEGVLKRYYGDQDAILFRMLRDECKYLEKNNG